MPSSAPRQKTMTSRLVDQARDLRDQRAAEARIAPLLDAALAKLDAAKDDKEKIAAVKDLAMAEARLYAEQLREIALGRVSREERREKVSLLMSMAAASSQRYSLQARALGIGIEVAQSDAARADLETVLRSMEEAGQISGPKVTVDERSQHEPTGMLAEAADAAAKAS